jgi:nucleolar pre-ribosomal-associated protein 2
VLDAMGMEVMRSMNAGMDASQRAIWKGLYEDWVRFGKWDGS